jgi:hypothetical protein
VKRPYLAVAAAHPEERPAGDGTTAKIAGFFHLGLVAEIEPAVIEDPAVFLFSDLRRGEDGAMHAKDAALAVFVDEFGLFHR